MKPNSARWLRRAQISIVRWQTNRSRVRCGTTTLCCSALLTGTKLICGRPTASANAAVSAASFFPRDREVFVALRHDPNHVQVFDKALEEIAGGRAQDHFLAMAVEP